jgi:hypothetical protein
MRRLFRLIEKDIEHAAKFGEFLLLLQMDVSKGNPVCIFGGKLQFR